MTQAVAAIGVTPGIVGRLRGGVHGSLSEARRIGHEDGDRDRLRLWVPSRLQQLLDAIHSEEGNPVGEPYAAIDEIAGELTGERTRSLLNAVIFSPHLAFDRMLTLCASREHRAVDAWIGLCLVTEAAWAVVSGESPGNAGAVTGDSMLLRPVAARARFLVLSEPMRVRGVPAAEPWLVDIEVLSGNGALDNVFGNDAWPVLVERCRSARSEWKDCLDAYQSHPLLSHVRPAQLEQEIRTLMFAGNRPGPLVLSTRPLREDASPTPEDRSVIADCTERHLLPRFALGPVTRMVLYDRHPGWRRARRLLVAAVAAAALAAVCCAIALLPYPAVGLAAACYVLIGVGVATLPAEWGLMWLLRMPAAAAVGAFALISFFPAGWVNRVPGGWFAAGTLLAASVGYLLIEVRNHGVARRAAPGRALLVALIGAVHGLLVTLIGLVWVAPAFSASGLGALWPHPGYRNAGMILAIGTAWCLTVGVFSQILWDDRPITAPLAHLAWRGSQE